MEATPNIPESHIQYTDSGLFLEQATSDQGESFVFCGDAFIFLENLHQQGSLDQKAMNASRQITEELSKNIYLNHLPLEISKESREKLSIEKTANHIVIKTTNEITNESKEILQGKLTGILDIISDETTDTKKVFKEKYKAGLKRTMTEKIDPQGKAGIGVITMAHKGRIYKEDQINYSFTPTENDTYIYEIEIKVPINETQNSVRTDVKNTAPDIIK